MLGRTPYEKWNTVNCHSWAELSYSGIDSVFFDILGFSRANRSITAEHTLEKEALRMIFSSVLTLNFSPLPTELIRNPGLSVERSAKS